MLYIYIVQAYRFSTRAAFVIAPCVIQTDAITIFIELKTCWLKEKIKPRQSNVQPYDSASSSRKASSVPQLCSTGLSSAATRSAAYFPSFSTDISYSSGDREHRLLARARCGTAAACGIRQVGTPKCIHIERACLLLADSVASFLSFKKIFSTVSVILARVHM